MSSPKKLITSLLLFACILSGIILAYTPDYIPVKITKIAELDSLIQLSFEDANLETSQIRIYNNKIDDFNRKLFRVSVPSSFSKTSFHLELHKKFYPFNIKTPARVIFPERDMNIYLEHNGTIFRTIRLVTVDSKPNE